MKILFLVPPETISLESSVPKALEGGKGYYPKLGLLYVAAYYEQETGNRPDLSIVLLKMSFRKNYLVA